MATPIQMLGAGGFGFVVGWYVYYINRHRKDEIKLSDLVTLIGVLGGTVILQLFPEGTDLFGAYGIGLFVGFFGYFAILVLWVVRSDNFTVEWFLDGRKKKVAEDEEVSEGRPMIRGEDPKRDD